MGAKRSRSEISRSNVAASSAREGARVSRPPAAAQNGFLSATDKQTAVVLFLLDAILLVGAVIIYSKKPSCDGFGAEVGDDAATGGGKNQLKVQFYGHNPPSYNQFYGGSAIYGLEWMKVPYKPWPLKPDPWLPISTKHNPYPSYYSTTKFEPVYSSYKPWPNKPIYGPNGQTINYATLDPPTTKPTWSHWSDWLSGKPSLPTSTPWSGGMGGQLTFPTWPGVQPKPTLPPMFTSSMGGIGTTTHGSGGSKGLASSEDKFYNKNFQCGVQQIKPQLQLATRIVGGSVATPHSWPWVVSVQLKRTSNYWFPVCGGTIVSPRHVITAVHCLGDAAEEKVLRVMSVMVGMHKQKTSGERYLLARSRNHPSFSKLPFYNFDLTLFTVNREIVFNAKVQPACLPRLNGYPQTGKRCWAYGWGAVNNRKKASEALKQVDLAIVSENICKKTFSSAAREVAVCAGTEKGQDTCQGDSGGPLTCKENGKWVLHGATSYGRACGSGLPAVYAATASSMGWLCCFFEGIPSCKGIACDWPRIKRPSPRLGMRP